MVSFPPFVGWMIFVTLATSPAAAVMTGHTCDAATAFIRPPPVGSGITVGNERSAEIKAIKTWFQFLQCRMLNDRGIFVLICCLMQQIHIIYIHCKPWWSNFHEFAAYATSESPSQQFHEIHLLNVIISVSHKTKVASILSEMAVLILSPTVWQHSKYSPIT